MAKEEEGEISGGKLKERGGSSSIKCLMLNSTKYTVWAIKMRTWLKVHKTWEIIEAGEDDGDKNDMATALLFQSIPESLVLQVGDLSTAKEIWEAIKTRHIGAERVKDARLQTLMAEFDRLKMKTPTKSMTSPGNYQKLHKNLMRWELRLKNQKLLKNFSRVSLGRNSYKLWPPLNKCWISTKQVLRISLDD